MLYGIYIDGYGGDEVYRVFPVTIIEHDLHNLVGERIHGNDFRETPYNTSLLNVIPMYLEDQGFFGKPSDLRAVVTTDDTFIPESLTGAGVYTVETLPNEYRHLLSYHKSGLPRDEWESRRGEHVANLEKVERHIRVIKELEHTIQRAGDDGIHLVNYISALPDADRKALKKWLSEGFPSWVVEHPCSNDYFVYATDEL